MRKSHYILIIGMAILIAGAIMNLYKVEPYGDYVLIAGGYCDYRSWVCANT